MLAASIDMPLADQTSDDDGTYQHSSSSAEEEDEEEDDEEDEEENVEPHSPAQKRRRPMLPSHSQSAPLPDTLPFSLPHQKSESASLVVTQEFYKDNNIVDAPRAIPGDHEELNTQQQPDIIEKTIGANSSSTIPTPSTSQPMKVDHIEPANVKQSNGEITGDTVVSELEERKSMLLGELNQAAIEILQVDNVRNSLFLRF